MGDTLSKAYLAVTKRVLVEVVEYFEADYYQPGFYHQARLILEKMEANQCQVNQQALQHIEI